MNKLYKITSVLTIAVLAVAFYLNASAKSDLAKATGNHGNNDQCNQSFTYDNQANDNRVLIDTINTSASGNPDSITVTAKTGYIVTSVKIELDDNNTNGWDVQTSGNLNSYNPPGTDIEDFEVTVKKVCATSTPTVTPSKSPTPTITSTPTVTPTVTPIITEEPTPRITETPVTPTITPEPTGQGSFCENNPQAEICIEIDCPGQGECEVVIGDPSSTPEPTQTPATPTPTQGSQGGTGSTSSSSSSNDSGSTGGASATNTPVATFANTGVFKETLSNGMFLLGSVMSAVSFALYGKKKKAENK